MTNVVQMGCVEVMTFWASQAFGGMCVDTDPLTCVLHTGLTYVSLCFFESQIFTLDLICEAPILTSCVDGEQMLVLHTGTWATCL